MNKPQLAFTFLVCCAAAISAPEPFNTLPCHTLRGDDAARLVRSLIKEQSKSLVRLQSYNAEVYEVITGDVIGDITRAEYDIQMLRDGEQMYVTNKRVMTGPEEPIRSHDVLVVNEAYVGYYTEGMGTAYIWEHDSPATMSARAHNQILTVTTGFDFSRYGFGTGIHSLSEVFTLGADIECKVTWASEPANSTQYVVEILDNADKDKTTTKLLIDGSRGYLVTQASHYEHSSNGAEADRISIVPREIAPGVWAPESCTWVTFAMGSSHKPPVKSRVREFTVRSIDLDISTVPRDFRLERLGLDPSVAVMRTDTRGRVAKMGFLKGELVPYRLLSIPTTSP